MRRAELTKETDGALADISAQHEQEIQNHSKPCHLRWWSRQTPEIRPFCCLLVVLDVLDVSVSDVAQRKEKMPMQQSPHCVGGGSDSAGGSVDAETRRVENRRAKLTDVWQPRKNALS